MLEASVSMETHKTNKFSSFFLPSKKSTSGNRPTWPAKAKTEGVDGEEDKRFAKLLIFLPKVSTNDIVIRCLATERQWKT